MNTLTPVYESRFHMGNRNAAGTRSSILSRPGRTGTPDSAPTLRGDDNKRRRSR
jgi:hypothetical protein